MAEAVSDSSGPRVDLVTVVGLALLILPIDTMWHEIGGHAATCAALGGRVATIGAFYVDCAPLPRVPTILVACAGPVADVVVASIAYALWRRARGDLSRLVLWYVWVSKALVASGYLCFSGALGLGDLGPGEGGGIGPLPAPAAWRVGELLVGVPAYILLVRAAIRALNDMLGISAVTKWQRRRIAHGFYLTAGLSSVLVGLLNPLGLVITLTSALASSFGGLAGFISIGFAVPRGADERSFVVRRNWPLLFAGAAVTLAFAVVLGPSIHPG